MKPEPGITAQGGRRSDVDAIARAKIEYAAGRGVEHDVVADWLRTWGTSERRNFRDWLYAQDG